MQQTECHLVQDILNWYSQHISVPVHFILEQEGMVLVSCSTGVWNVYWSCYSGAAVTSVHLQSLSLFAWMGHLCNTIRLPGTQKRAAGYLPRGGMALPSNMLALQKGEICYMGERWLGCELWRPLYVMQMASSESLNQNIWLIFNY